MKIQPIEKHASVGSDNDFPPLLEEIPQQLRERRELSQIETGFSVGEKPIHEMPSSFVPIPMRFTRYSQLSLYPWIHIFGGKDCREEFGRRLFRLTQSVKGARFVETLEKFAKNFDRIEIDFTTTKRFTQIVVSVISNEESHPFDDSWLPIEWCSSGNRQQVDGILSRIHKGEGNIQIITSTPYREVVLEQFKELGMRPEGMRLLIELTRDIGYKILVDHKDRDFSHNSQMIDGRLGSLIHMDVTSVPPLLGISKHLKAFIFLPADPISALAHELIHALRQLKVPHEEDYSGAGILKSALYDPTRHVFVLEGGSLSKTAYPFHTNFSEQLTIRGGESEIPSENSIRFCNGDPLRIFHSDDPFFIGSPVAPFLKPCDPLFMGAFPKDYLHIALMKEDKQAVEDLTITMKIEEIALSLEQLCRHCKELTEGVRRLIPWFLECLEREPDKWSHKIIIKHRDNISKLAIK